MIFSVVPTVLLAFGQGSLDRVTFVARLQNVQNEMRYAQVIDTLGRPERIATRHGGDNDSRYFEEWQYGLSPNGLATFGSVSFCEGQVYNVEGLGDQPPAPAVMPEKQLRSAIDSVLSACRGSDTLELIRGANRLIELGTVKSLVVLRECCRISLPDYRLINLAKIAGMDREAEWKTIFYSDSYLGVPFLAEDIPLTVPDFSPSGGRRMVFSDVQKALGPEYKTRDRKLKPSADPFKLLLEALELIARREAKSSSPNAGNGVAISKGVLTNQVIALVRTVYEPSRPIEGLYMADVENIRKMRAEWLKLGAFWDAKSEMYVPKNRDIPKMRTRCRAF